MNSDYIIYVDESGEPNPSPSDANNPMFVLAFCIFNKKVYAEQITPVMQSFKFRHFGHDIVILHEREIRKAMAPFQFLMNESLRTPFFEDLNRIMDESPFWIVAAAIRKSLIKPSEMAAENLYHLALQIGLEGVYKVLEEESQLDGLTHFVFESRGKKEDKELELEFRRICESPMLIWMAAQAAKRTRTGVSQDLRRG